MRKIYKKPTADIIRFRMNDIIASSTDYSYDTDYDENSGEEYWRDEQSEVNAFRSTIDPKN